MTTQINNSAKYLTSLRVGSLQVGPQTVSTSFTRPIRIGSNAGKNLSTGDYTSLVIGDESGKLATGNPGNITIVGGGSGNAITTGTSNVIFGSGSGVSPLVTGSANTIVGNAANLVVDGDSATIVGFFARGSPLCVTMGYAAVAGSSTAVSNVCIGATCGTSSLGGYNTTVGSYSLRTGLAALQNCCSFGYGALGYGTKTTAVDGACAFGRESLRNLTTGAHNAAFGYASGGTLTTGGYNTLMGYAAGQLLTGSYNTIVGADPAGVIAVSGAVALGAGVTAATDTFSIALTNAGTTFSTGLTPAQQNGGYQNCPTDCGYLLVYFNGVAKRILVYNNA